VNANAGSVCVLRWCKVVPRLSCWGSSMSRLGLPVLCLAWFALPATAAPVPDKISELVGTLKSGKPGERVIAAETLGDMGPAAADALPALLEVVRECCPSNADPLPASRYLFTAICNTFVQIGPKSVPVLAELLAHDSPDVREAAAIALKRLGGSAEAALPALVKALTGTRIFRSLWPRHSLRLDRKPGLLFPHLSQ
jgi:hypothetical protein